LINRSDNEAVDAFLIGARFGFAACTTFLTTGLLIGFGVNFLLTFGFGLTTAFLLGAAVGLTPFFDAVMINWLSWVNTSTQVLSKH
jgi:hypothetical protein